jgi:prefoldin subunit 5
MNRIEYLKSEIALFDERLESLNQEIRRVSTMRRELASELTRLVIEQYNGEIR